MDSKRLNFEIALLEARTGEGKPMRIAQKIEDKRRRVEKRANKQRLAQAEGNAISTSESTTEDTEDKEAKDMLVKLKHEKFARKLFATKKHIATMLKAEKRTELKRLRNKRRSAAKMLETKTEKEGPKAKKTASVEEIEADIAKVEGLEADRLLDIFLYKVAERSAGAGELIKESIDTAKALASLDDRCICTFFNNGSIVKGIKDTAAELEAVLAGDRRTKKSAAASEPQQQHSGKTATRLDVKEKGDSGDYMDADSDAIEYESGGESGDGDGDGDGYGDGYESVSDLDAYESKGTKLDKKAKSSMFVQSLGDLASDNDSDSDSGSGSDSDSANASEGDGQQATKAQPQKGQAKTQKRKGRQPREYDEDHDKRFNEVYGVVTKKKKNRAGQKARRLLYEQKYGSEANHIKLLQKKKTWFGKSTVGSHKAKHADEKPPKPAAPVSLEPVHPSWEAKRKQKELMEQAKSIKGTKILFSKSTLNPIRVVELKYLLNYGETLTQVRWTNRNARKQQLVDMLTDQFKLLFEKRDRANYELLLGCASQYSKTIATQEYYSWHNSLAYPYSKTNGAWLQFDVANRPAPWTLGSSPGCLVEQSSMASLVGGRAGSKSQPSAVSFDRLEFASSDLVTPVEPVHQAVVYMETRGVMHSKQMSFKLSADVVELLEDDPQRNDGARHGVFWFMCDYEDASAYLRQTPKRPVSVRYPSIMSMVVNSRAIQLPNMAQMRPDTPIELASHLVKSSVVNNVVHVNYRTDGRYVGMLMVAKVHTKQSIIAEIRNTSYVDAAKVRNEFFGSSSTDADDDLVSTGALVSLKCPLGLSRVTIPSRSRFCAHSQCFDCDTFLQMHMNIATWKCPVCSMVIKSWRELIIDGYFDSILKGTSEDDEQVYVEADGTWKAKDSLAAKGGAQLHKKRRLSDEDSADNDAIDLSDSSSLGSPRQSRAIKRARNDDVVDLTLDSDSDSGKEPDADDMLNAITQDDIEFIEAMMTSSENNAGTTRTANVRTTTRIAQSQPMVTVTPVRGLHGPRYDSASASRSDVEKFQAITDAFSDYIRQAIPKPISPMRIPYVYIANVGAYYS
ncbi:E3 SUMO-protein ligase pli1 [Coemansia sp. Benny D115]|nr:E3 SUMO-protein ligase pli1 [Coemansia sp. Benny D115]